MLPPISPKNLPWAAATRENFLPEKGQGGHYSDPLLPADPLSYSCGHFTSLTVPANSWRERAEWLRAQVQETENPDFKS